MDDLTKLMLLDHNLEFIGAVERCGLIGPSHRLIYGMSAHGGTDVSPAFATLHATMEKARAHRFGWDDEGRREWQLAFGMDDGIRNLMTLWDEYGEGRTDYFAYHMGLDEGLDEVGGTSEAKDEFIADMTDEDIEERVRSMLGVGERCTCSICLQDGDCCGNMITYSMDFWKANETGTLWYGKVYSSRNI